MQSPDKKPIAPTAREPCKPTPAEPRVLDMVELAAVAGGAAKPGAMIAD